MQVNFRRTDTPKSVLDVVRKSEPLCVAVRDRKNVNFLRMSSRLVGDDDELTRLMPEGVTTLGRCCIPIVTPNAVQREEWLGPFSDVEMNYVPIRTAIWVIADLMGDTDLVTAIR